MWRTPYRDLSWHQKDLAEGYGKYFSTLTPSVGAKPAATTDAQGPSIDTNMNISPIPSVSPAIGDAPLKNSPSDKKPKKG